MTSKTHDVTFSEAELTLLLFALSTRYYQMKLSAARPDESGRRAAHEVRELEDLADKIRAVLGMETRQVSDNHDQR